MVLGVKMVAVVCMRVSARSLNRPGFDGGSDDTEGSLSWDLRKYPDELR